MPKVITRTCIGRYDPMDENCKQCGLAQLCRLIQTGKVSLEAGAQLLIGLVPERQEDRQIMEEMAQDLRNLGTAGYTTFPQYIESETESTEEQPSTPVSPAVSDSSLEESEPTQKQLPEEETPTIQPSLEEQGKLLRIPGTRSSIILQAGTLPPSDHELMMLEELLQGLPPLRISFSKRKVGRGGYLTFVKIHNPKFRSGFYLRKDGKIKHPTDPTISMPKKGDWVVENIDDTRNWLAQHLE